MTFHIEFEKFIASGATLAVLPTEGDILYFRQRGVIDLFSLYERGDLTGCEIADKVTGVGAAVIMIAGGVSLWHTAVISRPAKELLTRYNIPGKADMTVDYIRNRAGTGSCPLEERLRPLIDSGADIMQLIMEIKNFIACLIQK